MQDDEVRGSRLPSKACLQLLLPWLEVSDDGTAVVGDSDAGRRMQSNSSRLRSLECAKEVEDGSEG